MSSSTREKLVRTKQVQLLSATLITFGVVGYVMIQAVRGIDSLQEIGLLWIVCVLIFAIADILAGSVEDGESGGYLFFITTVTWLTLGLVPAYLMVLLGASGAGVARLRGISVVGLQKLTPLEARENVFKRVAIHALSLGLMAGLTGLLDQAIPFHLHYSDGFVIGFIVVLGYAIMYAGQYGFSNLNRRKRFASEWGSLLTDAMLVALTVPMAYIFVHNGPLLYGTMLTLIALQIVRRHQVAYAQITLLRRVEELSMLNNIGQRVASQLVLDDVLLQVEDWAQTQRFGLFYIALLDDAQQTIEFPIVMRHDQRVTWETKPIHEDPLIQKIMNEHELLNVDIHETSHQDSVLDDVTLATRYMGFPLRAGNKFFGVMGIVEDMRYPLVGRLMLDSLQTVANQIGLAVRNAMLYGRTVHLAESLRQINASVQDLMFNIHSEASMRRACELAAQIVGATKAVIFMREHPREKTLRVVHALGLTDAHRAIYESPSYPFRKHLEQFARIIPNVTEATDPQIKAMAQAGNFQAMAEIPMVSSNVMGMLTVFHDMPHDYQQTELELLGAVANQVMAATDNAQLLTALETYASEQAQLVHLSRISTSSLDLVRLVLDVAGLLQEMLRSTWTDIGLIPAEANYLQLYRSDEQTRQAIVLDDLPEIRDAVARTFVGPHVYYAKTSTLSRETQEWMHDQKIQTLVVMLLMANNRLIGVTLLGYDHHHLFSDSETRLLEMATNQIATQLHNALQYGETERQLDWRLQQLSLIEGIAQQISSALSLDKLIGNLLEAAVRATTADMASLALQSDVGTIRMMMLRLEDGIFHYAEAERNTVSGVMEQVFRNGRGVTIPNNKHYVGYVSDYDYSSSLALPLIHNDEVIGVLNLESNEENHFREEQTAFLNSLVGHAVVSIQNARLLQEREAQIQTLNQLRELSLQLSVETNPRAALEVIASTMLDLIQGERVLVYRIDQQTLPFAPIFTLERNADGILMEYPPLDSIQAAVDRSEVQVFYGTTRTGVAVPVKYGYGVADVFFVWLDGRYRRVNLNNAALLGIQASGHLQNVELVERIRTQNNRTQAILDSTRDGVILFDLEGAIIEANASAEELLGIDLLDYVGSPIDENLLPDLRTQHTDSAGGETALFQLFQETLRQIRIGSERTTSGALEVRLEGRRIRYLHQVSSPVTDSHNEAYGRLLTFRDVTEEQLLAAYRDEIASMVVHDLRGPLGAMLSSMALVEEIADENDDDDLKKIVEVTTKSGRKLLDLVDSLLDVAKLETRQMPIRRSLVSLPDIIEEARAALLSMINEADIHFMTDLPPDLPMIYIDGDKIRRVLINLLDNAVRYTPVSGNVLVRVLVQEDKLRVTVADSGPGIPADQMTRIFEKFRQADNSSVKRRGGKGSGLGLTFCKLTLEAHSESIWVELPGTGPLPGACITFTLPIVPNLETDYSDEDKDALTV